VAFMFTIHSWPWGFSLDPFPPWCPPLVTSVFPPSSLSLPLWSYTHTVLPAQVCIRKSVSSHVVNKASSHKQNSLLEQ
jgi:hypothetical protein